MKKLILSFIAVGMTAITLVSSTFAWISLNSTVYVDGLEFTVTGGENILLSVDNTHWYQSLTTDLIKKATVSAYKGYKFNDEEELMYDGGGLTVSDEDIETLFSEKIKLTPLTSQDGTEFTDLYGSTIDASLGKFLTFDLYFASESNKINKDTDVFFYHGPDKTLPSGDVISASKVTSSIVEVELKNKMTTFDSLGETLILEPTVNGVKNKVSVNPANALRFSTNDVYNNDIKIFEVDAYNQGSDVPATGLGSYATDFSGYQTGSGGAFMARYDSTKNAAFTYYNNLKDTDLTPIQYNEMPTTVRDFNSYENARVCTLRSVFGYTSKVRFSYWLEGWDADCFDGIGNTTTKINITFTTTGELDYEPIHVKFLADVNDETPFAEYAKANPGSFLSPALAPQVAGKLFTGWAVQKSDGTIETTDYDRTIDLKTLVEQYYPQKTYELTLVALYE